MIYITWDCHGDYLRFSTENFPEQKQMMKEDYVIIARDFGFWKTIGNNILYRINHELWWKEELPSWEEMDIGIRNLEKHYNKVDYIITHCCATSTQALMSAGLFKADILTDYLEKIRINTDFKRWYFGHYHDNKAINDKEMLLYEQIIRMFWLYSLVFF